MKLKLKDDDVVSAMHASGLFWGTTYLFTSSPDKFCIVNWINEHFGEDLANPYTIKDFVGLLERKIGEPPKKLARSNGFTLMLEENQAHALFCKNKACLRCHPDYVPPSPFDELAAEAETFLITEDLPGGGTVTRPNPAHKVKVPEPDSVYAQALREGRDLDKNPLLSDEEESRMRQIRAGLGTIWVDPVADSLAKPVMPSFETANSKQG